MYTFLFCCGSINQNIECFYKLKMFVCMQFIIGTNAYNIHFNLQLAYLHFSNLHFIPSNRLVCSWFYALILGYNMPRNSKENKAENNASHRKSHTYMSAEEQAAGKKTYWTELEITGTIRNLSPNLFLLHNLTALYLKNNSLQLLPSDICHLINLRTLDLSHNKLRSLPAEVGDLIHLRYVPNVVQKNRCGLFYSCCFDIFIQLCFQISANKETNL